VLARVIGERHARVALDALELAAQAERGGEAHGARVPVTQADRRHRRDHRAARRSDVRESGREVPADDLVDGI
jgi:hypothetical protein